MPAFADNSVMRTVFLYFHILLMTPLFSSPAWSAPAAKPKFYLVLHADKLGLNIDLWAPTIAAALKYGDYSEVHIVSDSTLSRIIPPQPGLIFDIIPSLDGADRHAGSIRFFNENEFKKMVESVPVTERTEEGFLRFLASPKGKNTVPRFEKNRENALRWYRKIYKKKAEEKLNDEVREVLRGAQRTYDHDRALQSLVVDKLQPGDRVVDESGDMIDAENPGTRLKAKIERLSEQFKVKNQPGIELFLRNSEYTYDKGARAWNTLITLEQHAYDEAFELFNWVPIDRTDVMGLFNHRLPGADEKKVQSARQTIFSGLAQGKPYDLFNFTANYQSKNVERNSSYFLEMLEDTLYESDHNAVIAPFGIPNDFFNSTIESLKKRFPGRIANADIAGRIPFLYEDLIRGAARFVTPDTGAVHVAANINPEATTVLIFPSVTQKEAIPMGMWNRAGVHYIEPPARLGSILGVQRKLRAIYCRIKGK